jgi:hypothetical protein
MDQTRNARRAHGGEPTEREIRKGLAAPSVVPMVEKIASGKTAHPSGPPIAQTRIVVGLERYFIFVSCCPFCGMEHAHCLFLFRTLDECAPCSNHLAEVNFGAPRGDLFSNPLLAYQMHNGLRIARCRGNTSRTYRLVPGPLPACFTPLGAKDRNSREAMTRLSDRGVPTSTEILALRDQGDLYHGDGFPKNR